MRYRPVLLASLCLPLAACIAPLPVKSVADPRVSGTVVDDGVPLSRVEVWLDHDGDDACEQPSLKTLTDEEGRFSFEGRTRNWTWVGWANNQFAAGCIRTAEKVQPFRIIAYNDPQSVDVRCDIAKPAHEACTYVCEGGWEGRC